MVGLSLSFDVDGRREQGAERCGQLVFRPVPRGAGSCPHPDELHQFARCQGRAEADRGGAYRVDVAARYVQGYAGA